MCRTRAALERTAAGGEEKRERPDERDAKEHRALMAQASAERRASREARQIATEAESVFAVDGAVVIELDRVARIGVLKDDHCARLPVAIARENQEVMWLTMDAKQSIPVLELVPRLFSQ